MRGEPVRCGPIIAVLCSTTMPRSLPALLVLLAACGTGTNYNARSVPGPDGGDDWYAIGCRNKSDCYDGAAELCPKGWIVKDGATFAGPRAWERGSELIIHCKRNLPPGVRQ